MTDIHIKQGEDAAYVWPLLNADKTPAVLTGYKVRSQVRSLSGNLLHSWTTELGNAIITQNKVMLRWTSVETADWKWTTGKYDIELVSPQNNVTRIASGYVNVHKETTR